MSFRKIEKVLKEEYDHSFSFMTVKRILEDIEIFRREELVKDLFYLKQ